MSIRFSQHGTFSNRIEGRLLFSEIVGPWNFEMVANWAKDSYPQALSLSHDGPWVFIAIMHGSMLCPPEAMTEMRRSARYAAAHLGVIANLFVAEEGTEGFLLMDAPYAKLYGDFGVYQRFTSLDLAKSFAEQLLR